MDHRRPDKRYLIKYLFRKPWNIECWSMKYLLAHHADEWAADIPVSVRELDRDVYLIEGERRTPEFENFFYIVNVQPDKIKLKDVLKAQDQTYVLTDR